MITHLYANMWNEEQFLPWFLRHYEWVDRIFLYDHNSTDRSREIASQASNVELRSLPGDEIDERLYLSMHNEAYKVDSRGVADWVLSVDVDELLYSVGKPIVHILNAANAIGMRVIKPHGYQVFEGEMPEGGRIGDATWKGVADNGYAKPCLFKPDVDIQYAPGRHYTWPADHSPYMGSMPGLNLYHIKHIDVARFMQRREMWRHRMSQFNKSHGYGVEAYWDDGKMYSALMASRARALVIVEGPK